MNRAISILLRTGLCLAAFLSAPASAVSNTYAIAPESKVLAPPESLHIPAGGDNASTVQLEADDTLESRIYALKQANSASETKVLQIGIGREVPHLREASSAALRWQRVAGGMAAQWRVSSPGARALRVGLEAVFLAPGVQVRFAGDDGDGVVYGPFTPAEIFAMGTTYCDLPPGISTESIRNLRVDLT